MDVVAVELRHRVQSVGTLPWIYAPTVNECQAGQPPEPEPIQRERTFAGAK